jgi:hypothetical protein
VRADAGFLKVVAALNADRSANKKGDQQSKREIRVLRHRKLSEIDSG